MPRLFVGLELPGRVIDDILTLREDINDVRWQSAAQLHLTLAFIGQVEPATETAIARDLRQVRGFAPTLQLRSPECPGNSRSSRHLWLPADPTDELMHLHAEVHRQLSLNGLSCDARRFRPHVTLARLGRQADSVVPFLEAHAGYRLAPFSVPEFTLFRSTPGPAGSRYDVLDRYPLGQAIRPVDQGDKRPDQTS